MKLCGYIIRSKPPRLSKTKRKRYRRIAQVSPLKNVNSRSNKRRIAKFASKYKIPLMG